MNYTQHPLSAAFPSMVEDDFRELILDIEKNGLRLPIITFEGQIIDGWHRYRACQEAGATPRFEALGPVDPVAYVLSANMHRRHLSGSQKSVAVVACKAWARPGNQPKGEVASPLATVREMAEAAGTSERTIQQAKRAYEAGLGDAVKEGRVTVERAAQVAKLPEEERAAAIEAPKSKPASKPENDPAARIAELEAKNADLQSRLDTALEVIEQLTEEVDAARRTLDAEDIYQQFKKEIVRAQEMARVTKARNFGLMDEVADLNGRLKSALRKIDRLEKAAKGAA